MKWWHIKKYPLSIEPVEVKKATDHFVVVYNDFWKKDQRHKRAGEYFETFAEAKQFLVQQCEGDYASAYSRLADSLSKLEKARAIQEPS